MVNAEELAHELRTRIDTHFEWLLVREGGRTFPLRKTEIDVTCSSGKVLLGVFDDAGFDVSRVRSMKLDGEEVVLELSSEFENTGGSASLIPRTSARVLTRAIELARLERANAIAAALVKTFSGCKPTRVALNAENARLAQIFLLDAVKKEVAVLADVTATMVHEAVMTTAMLWFEKLRSRKKPISEIWVVAERKQARSLRTLFGLLNETAASSFRLFEIAAGPTLELKELSRPASLWRERPKKISLPAEVSPTETARRILDLSPQTIDVIYSKQGETLRFRGLPFARVRTMAGHERAWFGIDRVRRPLTEATFSELVSLLRDLETYRDPSTPNSRHEYYRMSSEAWLESILRRNIRQLDANLILSPIYNQFRASADKIDLLAIRRDGRLIIIELKTSPDREMVFQAADYWRKIEMQRRRGELARVRAFGDMQILDKPALVYAVAPALSFHGDFGYFARSLRREIEVWRFELREDWRSEIKVLARRDYPPGM
jgi:hypothetical protein